MSITHLVQKPLLGDASLKIPPYDFIKAKAKDLLTFRSILAIPDDREFLCSLIIGYVVKDKQKVIACAVLSRVGGFPFITHLWVDQDYRRKGLGLFLVNLCVLKIMACNYMDLHVYVEHDNIPAQELFKKLGFEESRYGY